METYNNAKTPGFRSNGETTRKRTSNKTEEQITNNNYGPQAHNKTHKKWIHSHSTQQSNNIPRSPAKKLGDVLVAVGLVAAVNGEPLVSYKQIQTHIRTLRTATTKHFPEHETRVREQTNPDGAGAVAVDVAAAVGVCGTTMLAVCSSKLCTCMHENRLLDGQTEQQPNSLPERKNNQKAKRIMEQQQQRNCTQQETTTQPNNKVPACPSWRRLRRGNQQPTSASDRQTTPAQSKQTS